MALEGRAVEVVGRYVIERRIGEGAMADVYRAYDPEHRPRPRDQGAEAGVPPGSRAWSAASCARPAPPARCRTPTSSPSTTSARRTAFPISPWSCSTAMPLDEHLRELGRMAFAGRRPDRRPARRRARLRARARRHPSRHQAVEHHALRRRADRQDSRFRHRPHRRGRPRAAPSAPRRAPRSARCSARRAT